MNTKKIWANLVSNDLEKTTKFYTALGFKQNGDPNATLTSFLFGNDNFIIHFFEKQWLENNGLKDKSADLKNGNEIIFSLSAESREDVDKWFEKIKAIGGTIFSEPENFEQGYTFGFADPDGHKFNVLYWPGM